MELTKRKRIAFVMITVILTASFAILGGFVFRSSYLRFWETLIELWTSIKFYFCEMFGIENDIVPTVIDFSKVFGAESSSLPSDFEGFKTDTTTYFDLLFSKENFMGWLKEVVYGLGAFGKIATIAIPAIIVVVFAVKQIYGASNTKHNKDTLPLATFKAISKVTYQPIKRILTEYSAYIKEHSSIWITWLVIWVLNLNLASVFVGFLAYYLYFAMSYQFETLYTIFVKLGIDLNVIFTRFPWWLIVLAFLPIFEVIRQKIATRKLHHMEARNCGFIKELPIVSMTCGSMGKKKTTVITDMALSQEVMFRQKAFEILQTNDMKFPNFPWIEFELELQDCMRHRTVYNLATVKAWVNLKRCRYERHLDSSLQLYGYDAKKYGITYDDKLKVTTLFDVLETYAQAYFIYVIESSLLVTNYSIREDNVLMDESNFPMWNTDFFPKRYRLNSKHAHILDFDVLRLGKKIVEENPRIGSFEFGVVVITEIGKERGNNLELKEVKKGTIETNQKNDLFNSWLKMCRHSATVDNYPFIKVFTDEQRPESWGADARDLADIVQIVKSGVSKITLPFFTIEEMLYEWTFNRFINLYYDFRYRRGDNTLLIYALKQVVSKIYTHYSRLYNRFGYCTLSVIKERGVMDGKQDKNHYYLMNKKIYSDRFSTDCFSDYFNDMATKTHTGLNDYLEYATEKASVDELKSQNSYFINALYKDADDN